ncbi:hypothetical protein pb186bvf_007855 [Paramecium bursaria]
MINGLLIQNNQRLTIFQKYIIIRLQQKLVDKGIAGAFKILKQDYQNKKQLELLTTNPVVDSHEAQREITEVEITIKKVKIQSQEKKEFQQINDVRILRTHKKKILSEFEKNKPTQEAEMKKYFKSYDEQEQMNQIQNLRNLIIQTKNDRTPIIKGSIQQENYFKEIIIIITILLFILSMITLVL